MENFQSSSFFLLKLCLLLFNFAKPCRHESGQEENGSKGGGSRIANTDWSGSFEWDERAADLRMNVFGITDYRTNQREVRKSFPLLSLEDRD